MEIIQKPSGNHIAGNIPDIVVNSNAEFEVHIVADGRPYINSHETYTPDTGVYVTIPMSEMIAARLKSQLPGDSVLFEQTEAVREISVSFNDSAETYPFKAIHGGVRDLSQTSNEFLRENFLTWQPQSKNTRATQPEWLTYFAVEDITVKLKAYFSDGTNETINLASLEALKMYTMDLGFQRVNSLFTKQVTYYDVHTENSENERLSYIQRYVLTTNYIENEQIFIFENSLGGIDSVLMTGETKSDKSPEALVGFIDDVEVEYGMDYSVQYTQYTGHIDSKNKAAWLQDFFTSTQKYLIKEGVFKPIVLDKSTIKESSLDDLHSFSFDYRFSKQSKYQKLTRSMDSLPENLEISTPGELFFLAPRLSEFPSLDLADTLTFPVQLRYTQEWGQVTLASIKANIISDVAAIGYEVNSNTSGDIDLSTYALKTELHSHSNKGLLDTLSVVGRYLKVGNEKIDAGNADMLGNIEAANYWNKTELINDALYLKLGADKIKAGYADLAYDSDRLGKVAASNYWQKTELINDALYLKLGADKIKAGYADLAYDSDRLGNIVAADYWNKFNSNLNTVDWKAKDLFVSGQASSENYISGFGGSGWRIDNDANATFDNLTVRKSMNIYELNINKIRSGNGSYWFSDGAKIDNIEERQDSYVVGFGDITHPFKEGDIIRCQTWTGKGVKYYSGRVYGVDFFASKNAFEISKTGLGDTPEIGDEIVRIGNISNSDRQGAIYVTSNDNNSPYMDVLDGVTSDNLTGKTKVRVGKLDGIIDSDFGILSGYGLYGENVYLKGVMKLANGSSISFSDVTNTTDLTNSISTAQSTANTANALAATKTDEWVTRITQDTITAQFVKTLGLTVGDHIQMGPDAVISWDKVTGTEDVVDIDTLKAQSNINLCENGHDEISHSSSGFLEFESIYREGIIDKGIYPGDDIVISAEGKVSSNGVVCRLMILSLIENVWVTYCNIHFTSTSYDRESVKFSIPQSSDDLVVRIYREGDEGISYLRKIKIEKGSIATSYSRSPKYMADIAQTAATSVANAAQNTANTANDLAESKTDAWATQISKDAITAEFLRTRNLVVGDHIQMGPDAVISWDKVTDKTAVTNGISTAQSTANDANTLAGTANTNAGNAQSTANTAVGDAAAAQGAANSANALAESKTDAWATQISKDAITAEFLRTRNLVVGDHIQMGPDAVISWDRVTGGQTAIDAVQIGGRNLLRNSNFEGSSYWNIPTIQNDVYNYVTIPSWSAKQYISTVAGQQYTVSFYVRNASSTIGHHRIKFDGENQSVYFDVPANTTEWTRIYVPIISQQTLSSNQFIVIYGSGGVIDLARPQIEIGNKATDWTPAPEDVDASIATKVTSAQATQITKDTITTTNLVAQNLQVQAANISGQLTASQINFDNAVGENVTLSGNITATTGLVGGFTIIDNKLNSTGNKIVLQGDGSAYIEKLNTKYGTEFYYKDFDFPELEAIKHIEPYNKNVTCRLANVFMGSSLDSYNKTIVIDDDDKMVQGSTMFIHFTLHNTPKPDMRTIVVGPTLTIKDSASNIIAMPIIEKDTTYEINTYPTPANNYVYREYVVAVIQLMYVKIYTEGVWKGKWEHISTSKTYTDYNYNS